MKKMIINLVLVLTLFGLISCDSQSEKMLIQGQVEAKQVNLSAKIPGRIDSILTHEGQFVEKGQLLVVMGSLELEAKLKQVQGAVDAASAQSRKANTGARVEQIQGAKAMWEKALQGENLAKITYERVQKLFDEGVVPAQKKDEAEANYKAMQATVKAAESQYLMAKNGARKEDKSAAASLVRQAKAGKEEVSIYLKEAELRAPFSGEVGINFAEAGEIVSAGLPVLNVTDLENIWVDFQVREDYLSNFKKGNEIVGVVPGVDSEKEFKFKITYISARADYATWRSVRESGGFDLKTFSIRARPVKKIEGLRPGMSVLFSM